MEAGILMNNKLNLSEEYIKFNDLLGLDDSEINNSKINLNMTSDGIECLKFWEEDNENVLFSY